MAGGGTRGLMQSMFACSRTGLFLPREYPCGYVSRGSLPPAQGASWDMLFVVIHSGKKSPREAPVPPPCPLNVGAAPWLPSATQCCGRERAGEEWRLLAPAGALALPACRNGADAPQEPVA